VPGKEAFQIRLNLCGDKSGKWVSASPFSPKRVMQHQEFMSFFLFWFCLLMPVPLMRVQLGDHSVEQAVTGAVLGAIYGFGWFQFIKWLSRKYSHKIGTSFFYGIFKHDYRPPEFRIKIGHHILDQTTHVEIVSAAMGCEIPVNHDANNDSAIAQDPQSDFTLGHGTGSGNTLGSAFPCATFEIEDGLNAQAVRGGGAPLRSAPPSSPNYMLPPNWRPITW